MTKYCLISRKELYDLIIDHHKLQVYKNIVEEEMDLDVDIFGQIEEKEQSYINEKLKGYGLKAEGKETYEFSDLADYEILFYEGWNEED